MILWISLQVLKKEKRNEYKDEDCKQREYKEKGNPNIPKFPIFLAFVVKIQNIQKNE